MTMLILTAAEMRALDREVIERVGVPGVVLMEAAGRGVADLIGALGRAPVTVWAGPGNNGGDGLVAARHLANRGVDVAVVLCAPAAKVRGDALVHLQACERSGVPILDGATAAGLAAAAARPAEVVVDALLGTGLEREVTGHLADAIARINVHAAVKIAVDIPSGLDADRGIPLGACVRADHTVTFAFAKRGLVIAPGFTFAGRLHVIDIGIPERLARAHGVHAELLDERVLDGLRRPRDPLGHKGTFGHLLVLAGSGDKLGAALLAGQAALRSGVGLCTVALPTGALGAFAGKVPELMAAGYLPDDAEAAWASLAPLVDGKRALAAGPGMPTQSSMRGLLAKLVSAALARDLGVVLDADALNHLAADAAILDGAPRPPSARLVLTPHPGEAARLLGRPVAEVQADRVGAATALAARHQAVVALKGARTIVAAPDGRLAVCPTGNPGLGTGGTGDVLTGCVGALLAEGRDAFGAATAAVYLHGAAGDLVADERGQRGLVAHDVVDALPRVLHRRR
jgi:NAD(P)H-hydrate epimerase